MTVIGNFDGMGGWTEGLALLDPDLAATAIGFEVDPWATRTAAAAGHRTIRADVETFPLDHIGPVDGYTASPPCQAFSAAGKRAGRDWVPALVDAAIAGRTLPNAPERVRLVLEPVRWITALRPRWIAMEQVPAVLPIWHGYCAWLERHGYSTWTGVLNAADFGVPQTRKRAILLASLDRLARCPEPTHDRAPRLDLFGPGLAPWVSMADALGWVSSGHEWAADRPSTTVCGSNPGIVSPLGGGTGVSVSERGYIPWASTADAPTGRPVLRTGQNTTGLAERYEREIDRPSPTVTSKANDWSLRVASTGQHSEIRRRADEPAPTLAFGHASSSWAWERPATTVVGTFSPDTIAAPGWRGPNDGPRQDAEGSIKVEFHEVLTLQSFRPDYPVQGPKTAKFLQAGNAIPPRLAAHGLAVLLGIPGPPA